MTPKPVIAFDWYRSFIEFLVNAEAHTWFAKIIIFGELAVALGLILGAFTGLAAFSGGLMNWSFIMAPFSLPPRIQGDCLRWLNSFLSFAFGMETRKGIVLDFV